MLATRPACATRRRANASMLRSPMVLRATTATRARPSMLASVGSAPARARWCARRRTTATLLAPAILRRGNARSRCSPTGPRATTAIRAPSTTRARQARARPGCPRRARRPAPATNRGSAMRPRGSACISPRQTGRRATMGTRVRSRIPARTAPAPGQTPSCAKRPTSATKRAPVRSPPGSAPTRRSRTAPRARAGLA